MSQAIWTPSQLLKEDDTHSVDIQGTVKDASGVTQNVDFQSSFTTANTQSPALWRSNFQAYPAGTNFTGSQINEVFGWNQGTGSGFGEGKQYAFWRDDPEGLRGTVMMMQLPKGKNVSDGGIKVETRIDFSGNNSGINSPGYEEIWMAYDVYLSPNYKCASGHKMPGIMAYGDAGPGASPEGRYSACRQMFHGALSDGSVPRPDWPYGWINKTPAPHGGDNCPGVLFYDANGSNYERFANKDDVDAGVDAGNASQQYNTQPGKWIRYKFHLQMNDVGSSNGYLEYFIDGTMRARHTGMQWRIASYVLWDLGYFTYFWGGFNTDWNSPDDQDQQCYIDKMVISETDPDA